ncbi:hypothetical protein [Nocardioides humilatus]|nr:hypothetical protein [Nocardioides humilatus]
MRNALKLTIAGLVTTLATTVAMAAPAEAAPVSPQRMLECC